MKRSILARFFALIRRPGAPRSSVYCTSCGADWVAGGWSDGCEECGGGALSRSCPLCQGRCGAIARRAVIDSNDEGCAHWIGACGLAPMAAAASRYLFRFGYQTPHQLRIMARNPDWDDEDSTWIFIHADSQEEAARLGFAYADAFVRRHFADQGGWLDPPPYVWSRQPYAHWIETDPIEIASAEAAGVAAIASASDIETLFRETPEK
jgi:hypothetical protein